MPGRIVLEIEPNPRKIVKRGKLKLWTGQVPSLPIERRLSKCGSLEIIPIDQASLDDAWEVSCLSPWTKDHGYLQFIATRYGRLLSLCVWPVVGREWT